MPPRPLRTGPSWKLEVFASLGILCYPWVYLVILCLSCVYLVSPNNNGLIMFDPLFTCHDEGPDESTCKHLQDEFMDEPEQERQPEVRCSSKKCWESWLAILFSLEHNRCLSHIGGFLKWGPPNHGVGSLKCRSIRRLLHCVLQRPRRPVGF